VIAVTHRRKDDVVPRVQGDARRLLEADTSELRSIGGLAEDQLTRIAAIGLRALGAGKAHG